MGERLPHGHQALFLLLLPSACTSTCMAAVPTHTGFLQLISANSPSEHNADSAITSAGQQRQVCGSQFHYLKSEDKTFTRARTNSNKTLRPDHRRHPPHSHDTITTASLLNDPGSGILLLGLGSACLVPLGRHRRRLSSTSSSLLRIGAAAGREQLDESLLRAVSPIAVYHGEDGRISITALSGVGGGRRRGDHGLLKDSELGQQQTTVIFSGIIVTVVISGQQRYHRNIFEVTERRWAIKIASRNCDNTQISPMTNPSHNGTSHCTCAFCPLHFLPR